MAPLLFSLLLASLSIHPALARRSLCNITFSDSVNGSGTVSFNPHFSTAQIPDGGFIHNAHQPLQYPISDPTWLVAVQETDEYSTQAAFFFNTAGVDYWNDTETLFDACAFVFVGPFPNNTAYLSQHDPGDCSVMLTPECRSTLITTAETAAETWLSKGTQNSHIGKYPQFHYGVVPYVCNNIANSINPSPLQWNAYLPKECWNDFGAGPETSPNMQTIPLTGYSRAIEQPYYGPPPWPEGGVDYSCPTFADDGTKYWWTGTYASQTYDFAMRQAWPILSVYFQVANNEVLPTDHILYQPSAQLSCPRARLYSKTSRIPPQLPSGTPTSLHNDYSGTHLSGGDIAGIVVGSVVFVALVLLIGFRHKRQRAQRRRELASTHGKIMYTEYALNDLVSPNSRVQNNGTGSPRA